MIALFKPTGSAVFARPPGCTGNSTKSRCIFPGTRKRSIRFISRAQRSSNELWISLRNWSDGNTIYSIMLALRMRNECL